MTKREKRTKIRRHVAKMAEFFSNQRRWQKGSGTHRLENLE